MDGFGENEGVIMMAATNRPDILDPALLRPGRFDRQIVVDVPDVKGREAILKVHSAKKPLANDVDLEEIAKAKAGYSGADLENLMNESAIFAARRNHLEITRKDIEDANLKVMMGTEKRSRIITEKEKKLTAFHEAGHAVLAKSRPIKHRRRSERPRSLHRSSRRYRKQHRITAKPHHDQMERRCTVRRKPRTHHHPEMDCDFSARK